MVKLVEWNRQENIYTETNHLVRCWLRIKIVVAYWQHRNIFVKTWIIEHMVHDHEHRKGINILSRYAQFSKHAYLVEAVIAQN